MNELLDALQNAVWAAAQVPTYDSKRNEEASAKIRQARQAIRDHVSRRIINALEVQRRLPLISSEDV
jgi:hypothetical protein